MERLEENPVRESTALQGSSNQPGAADAIERLEGDLFDQIKSLFNKNAEIAKLDTAQTELTRLHQFIRA